MDSIAKYLIVYVKLFTIFNLVSSHTYTVKVGTESHINVVDRRFLSFTVDPKYLFASTNGDISQESISMASSLAPAYIRIAGPSTAHMTLHNSTITFTDLTADLDLQSDEEEPKQKEFGLKKRLLSLNSEDESLEDSKKSKEIRKRLVESDEDYGVRRIYKNRRISKGHFRKGKTLFGHKKEKERYAEDLKELAVSYSQLNNFVQWANKSGFDLVFALNNEEKMSSGLWDPNAALNMLTMAKKANFSGIYWQLGYECSNQSIDEYLNDLETLRAIVESFEAEEWRTVGGDVTKCLQEDSKSDFRDYVTLTEDLMDAVFLNGNSSAFELQRMTESDRLKLLKLLSTSSTPLWLTESAISSPRTELNRAADWMTGLGYSARNGFAHHFRDLTHHELFNPTLSFYMALLFKNLVGERVLDVDMEASEAVLFAHCTSLRHKPVPGAVTLYGANLDDETARFAVKLSRKEEGGDILQFILGHDLNGNIIVNGRTMFESDIHPVVKKVRPFKTLLLSLPPRSFGFWVIANTKIEACYENEEKDVNNKEFVEALPIDDEETEGSNTVKTKRSMIFAENPSVEEVSKETLVKEGLKERIDNLNSNLSAVHKIFEEKTKENVLSRRKRQIDDEDQLDAAKRKLKKLFRNKRKNSDEPKPRLDFLRKLIGLNTRSDTIKSSRDGKVKRLATSGKSNKAKKKHNSRSKPERVQNNFIEKDYSNNDTKVRKRRSVISEKNNLSIEKDDVDVSPENEIDVGSNEEKELWKILRKIHKQINDLPPFEVPSEEDRSTDVKEKESKEDHIVVKTKLSDDVATIKYKHNKSGLLKKTVDNVMGVLSDLNNNLNRFWDALTFLD